MIILDTNVISELFKPRPAREVVAWLDAIQADSIFLTAVTVAEVAYGVARLPDGERKATLGRLVDSMIREDFDGRVLSFDEVAAFHYGLVVSGRDKIGRPMSMADAQIASIALSHGAPCATRNTTDFEGTGIEVINPWKTGEN